MSKWNEDYSLTNARVSRVLGYGSYAGAEYSEWNQSWNANNASPDTHLSGDLEVLRARSADLHRNSALISGATQGLAVGVVGRGIRPRAKAVSGVDATQDAEIRNILDREWAEFQKTACADGVTSFYELQNQAVLSMVRDGDVLAIFPDIDNGKSLAVDLIAANRVSTPQKGPTDRIRHGVEYKSRRVAAYWVSVSEDSTTSEHYRFPIDRNGRLNARMLTRPMAKTPGQSRAVPLISAAIGRVKDVETYAQAEIRRAVASAKVTGVLSSPDPQKIAEAWSNLQSGNELAETYKSRSFGQLFDAQIMSLASGESMQMFSPNNTNPGFGGFIETTLKQIAGCYGTPWSVCFNILDKLNYSNARTNKTAARRVYELWQSVLIDNLCQPTWELFVTYLWANGKLPGVRAVTPDLLRCEWRTDVERWIDPAKEVSAAGDAIALGLASNISACSDIGEDAYEVARNQMDYVQWRKAELELRGLDEFDLGFVPSESYRKTESETETIKKDETKKPEESPDE